MSAGITIAIVDATNQGTPTGFYIMRDAGYGTLLGAAMGAVVGCLLWVDMNKAEGSKRVLQGAAWGTLFGAGAGIAYGVLEGQSGTSSTGRSDNGLRLGSGLRLMFAPAPTPHGLGLAAQLAGSFG
jgi:di/tricarboxylate transporter